MAPPSDSSLIRPYGVRMALVLSIAGFGSVPGCGGGDSLGPRAQGEIRVLFVGNSLTSTNNLPGVVKALAESDGTHRVTVRGVTKPNYGLEDHWNEGAVQDLIESGDWDVVVLQQGPSATEGRPSLIEFSRRLADLGRATGTRAALYMVWPAASRSFDFDDVSTSHRLAAEGAGGMLFPVGEAWRAAWKVDPSIPLYGADGFHPSPTGTYLAALVIVHQLMGSSLVGLPGTVQAGSTTIRIDEGLASVLQAAAIEAVRIHGIR